MEVNELRKGQFENETCGQFEGSYEIGLRWSRQQLETNCRQIEEFDYNLSQCG